MDRIVNIANDFALNLAESSWVHLVVLLFSALDAVIPMVPSESVVVALAAISQTSGAPNLVLLGLAAGFGALLGDNLTFQLGRLIGLDRFAWMRRPRMVRAVDAARRELDHRSALLILTARYVPVGRVAVNLTAGATGFGFRRFFPLSVIAATTWASYAVVVGVLAGTWVKENPLYGAAVAVTFAVVIGLAVDRLLAWWRGRRPVSDS